VVVAVGLITGFVKVDVEPSEPVHNHAVAWLETADKPTVPPSHIGLVLVGAAVGIGLTVAIVT
jgi:hypothetical protein